MCLSYKTEKLLPRVEAFKLFGFDTGKLMSPFKFANPKELVYEPNVEIEVDDPDEHFYAFEKFDHAMGMCLNANFWDISATKRFVLPVTLIDVRFYGGLKAPNEDIQCLDYNYTAYMSKRIIVHDTAENRVKYLSAARDHLLRSTRYSLNRVERDILNSLLATSDLGKAA